jgi:DNA-binding response OmpR family regulator
MGHDTPVILLISDDVQFTYLVARYGNRCGTRVISVTTLEAALSQIQRARPALVVLDGLLAPPGSWPSLQALKAGPATGVIPVALASAVGDEARAWGEGADYWLAQPVLYDDFLAVLQASGALVRRPLDAEP